MNRQYPIALAAGGSAALLLAAWGFQYLGGLAPCQMCIWQRWPHGAAVLIGCAAILRPGSLLIWAGAMAAMASAGIGAYHTGVERGWWPGPATCSSGSISDLTAEELLDQIMAAPLVRCDEVAWEFLSLSMASWNMLLSLGLVVLWLSSTRIKEA